MRGQFHALRFAAGECGRRLTQPQVAEPHFFQNPQLLGDLGHFGKELQRFFYRQIKNFVDVLAAVTNVQNLRFKPGALALLADQFHVRQKLHLDRDRAVALAGFAASPWNVE